MPVEIAILTVLPAVGEEIACREALCASRMRFWISEGRRKKKYLLAAERKSSIHVRVVDVDPRLVHVPQDVELCEGQARRVGLSRAARECLWAEFAAGGVVEDAVFQLGRKNAQD